MRIFDIPKLFEHIEQALAEGNIPDQAIVGLLVAEGPQAFDWVKDRLAELEAIQEAQKKRINEIKERMESAAKEEQRLKDFVGDILPRYFNGKVKTPLTTVYMQTTKKYDYNFDETMVPQQYLRVNKELDKKAVLEIHKNGGKVDGVTITESEESSVRFK